MNIGIIGSGKIGATAAELFADAGHEVAVSNSRGPESLVPLVEEIGSNAPRRDRRAGRRLQGSGAGRDAVLRLRDAADRLAGKVVVDAMNYHERRDGRIDFDRLTSGEVVARHLPDSRLVKTFNTRCTTRRCARRDAPQRRRRDASCSSSPATTGRPTGAAFRTSPFARRRCTSTCGSSLWVLLPNRSHARNRLGR